VSKEREPLAYSGIFFDSPDLVFFSQWYETGILGGATLNPPSLKKAGVTNVEEHFEKMVNIVGQKPFPISVEIPDTDWPEEKMIELGLLYHKKFPENAVIKVPMDPRNPWKAFFVLKELGENEVRTNATLGLTAGQLISAAEAGRLSNAKGDNYVSLFWGRREEARLEIFKEEEELLKSEQGKERYYPINYKDNMRSRLFSGDLIADAEQTLTTTLNYLERHKLDIRVIVGSIRRPYQIEKAFSLGADIVTIPPEILSEWMRTKRGKETANEFNDAYRSVKESMVLIEGFTPPE